MSRISVVSIFAALSVALLTFSLQAQHSPQENQPKPREAQADSSTPAEKAITESIAELEEESRQSVGVEISELGRTHPVQESFSRIRLFRRRI